MKTQEWIVAILGGFICAESARIELAAQNNKLLSTEQNNQIVKFSLARAHELLEGLNEPKFTISGGNSIDHS